MTTIAIVQARMTSSRLPGKVLRPIRGRPMLAYQLQSLRRVAGVDGLVVATTVNASDDPIVALCESESVASTRGSELDVLSRYQEAASQFEATTVVRLTSDCPMLDPRVVEDALHLYFSGAKYDYVSNMLEPTYPQGMAVEVVSSDALRMADLEARDPAEREHVTPFIYWRPERFRLGSLRMEPNLTRHRWTVDTPEDFDLVSRMIGLLGADFSTYKLQDALHVLGEHPEWENINSHIRQRNAIRESAQGENAPSN